MKCSNCDTKAEYKVGHDANTQYFCSNCLPWSYMKHARTGALPKIQDEAPTPATNTTTSKKKATSEQNSENSSKASAPSAEDGNGTDGSVSA